MKDQWLAVCLSSIFPGIGQIYGGNRLKGKIFIFLQAICAMLALGALLWWAGGNSIIPFMSFMFFVALFPLYNLFDAYATVRQFNESSGVPVPPMKKQPFLAVFLSAIIPGLGQLYNKQWIKGIGFFVAVMFVSTALKALGLIGVAFIAIGVTLSKIFEVCATLFILNDAYASAQKINGLEPNIFNRWNASKIQSAVVAWIVLTLILPAIIAVGIRSYYISPYKIPTGAMQPVIQQGDRIFANKWVYRNSDPQRGDIAIFESPKDSAKDFIKRIVGLPGEQLKIEKGNIYINGELLDTPKIPKERFYYNRVDWEFGKEGQTINIPENSYFVLGDNSPQSSDSRNWGFVPRSAIKAKATQIWWPPKRLQNLE